MDEINVTEYEEEIEMKKFDKFGYIAIGMVLTLIVSTATPAFAATKNVVKQLTAYFTSGGKPISIYVNGTKITPKDGNGKEVSPFTVDGTTYLPVKAIADALGKSVAWDGATASVKIADKATTTALNTQDNNNTKLAVTKDGNGVIHESLEYTFTLDKDAVGEWKTIGWYPTMSDFDPAYPSDQKQWYVGNSIYADGTMIQHHTVGSNNNPVDETGLHWTKGYFVDLMGTDVIPAYSITAINGKTYMFMEWKSEDYISRGQKPSYYVFEKTSDTPAPGVAK